ncbi:MULTISPECIES: hypothetical protein [unclassified Phenylobacterium]|uniref:hypothetical protein n=1 Tax=unclassified Phenylobacterium TaxID=2640670 RepID=UPI00083AB0D1|nr:MULTISPECIES: hypothetical protein [unclassified Phenylobacterium]
MENEGNDVAAKSREVIEQISKAAGVDAAATEKVLNHLGLQTSLAKNPNAVAANMKIAATPVMQ